jgi:hypothetical protein
MHTDLTLKIFDDETTSIGAEFRKFNNNTCSAFETHELRRETETRKRRQSKKAKANATDVPSAQPSTSATAHSEAEGPLPKRFNLQTYKYHSLGDHSNTIQTFGTTDSYSTEPVRNTTIFNIYRFTFYPG